MQPKRRGSHGRSRISGLLVVCCLTIAGLLTACDMDLLGLTYRKIAGDYALMKGEDGETFYVVDRTRKDETGGDMLGGEIAMINWTKDTIIVQMSPHRADVWMIIDVASKKISGPYNMAGIHRLNRGRRLNISKPQWAWSQL